MVSQKLLAEVDPEISQLLAEETKRKEFSLELIPSENATSEAVLEVTGSILTDKYCEGYPGKRYYGGCDNYDGIERLARDRAKQLFGAERANVQPHSGANANLAAFMSVLKPGDILMGPRLDHGGHLTHGSPVNFSGQLYKAVGYGVHPETHRFDMDEVRKIALEHRPKLIVTGATAYPRTIDWKAFRDIADEVSACLLSDISHYSGLVVGGVYDNPFPHADIVTSTTHKTLRGPRGGIILCKSDRYKAINKAVFPGTQGGPLMHQIAAKAVAFKEALSPEFKVYAGQIVANARALAEALLERGIDLVSGGTDSHLLLLDLRSSGANGAEMEAALEKIGITVNKNTIPNDPLPASVTSGIRIGTPALTTRGCKEEDMKEVAACISDAIKAKDDPDKLAKIRRRVIDFCQAHPLFPYRLN